MAVQDGTIYEFADFRLFPDDDLLLRDGEHVPLPPKSFSILLFLIERRGHLVRKSELMERFWADSFVEESAVSRCVWMIRNALGEDSRNQQFIQTVPKRGYKFVAAVNRIENLQESQEGDVPFDPDATPKNAYQAYQLSRYHFNKVSFPDLMKSRFWLEEAVKFDPRFAPAHAALVEQFLMEVLTHRFSPAENFPKAKDSLRRAAELDSSSAEFYVAAGFAALICDRNFVSAEQNLRKSLEINPHHVLANKYFGEVLMFLSRTDESEFYLRRAVEIDPLGLHSPIILMIALFLARKYQELLAECDKYLALYPQFPVAVAYRGLALEQVGRAAEAIVEYERILCEPGTEFVRWFSGSAYALIGDRESALKTIALLDAERDEHYLSPTFQAVIYAALDEPQKAYDYLEKGLSERDPWMLWTAADPRYDKLRVDPRFESILKRMGFETPIDGREICRELATSLALRNVSVDRNMSTPRAHTIGSQADGLRASDRFRKRSEPALPALKNSSEPDISLPEVDPLALGEGAFRKRGVRLYFLVAIISLATIGFSAMYLTSEGTSTLEAAAGNRIAVLPLKPIDLANRSNIYEIGIADALINQLSSAKGVVVRPLSATRKYTEIEQDPVAAGRDQQVDYVLASNYQLADGKILITTQLLNVWTAQVEETYQTEKASADLFAMQSAIASDIGNRVLVRFGTVPVKSEAKRGTNNEKAYESYLTAINLSEERGIQNVMRSLEYLERAVALDPDYALAWADKALIHGDIVGHTDSGQHEHYQSSMEAIRKALSIDPTLSVAYSALCHNKNRYEYDFAGAETACKRAIEFDPNSAVARKTYANFLYSRGRFDDSIVEIKTAIDLQPVSYRNQQIYALALYYAQRYGEAEAQFKRLIELNPNHSFIHGRLIRVLEEQGKESEAYQYFIEMLTLRKTENRKIERYKAAYRTTGWRGVTIERIKAAEADQVPSSFVLACLYAKIGEKNKALDYLERAYTERSFLIAVLQVEPQLSSLHDNPRFVDLVRRIEGKSP